MLPHYAILYSKGCSMTEFFIKYVGNPFLRGIGSIININGSVSAPREQKQEILPKSDLEGLRRDWQQVGGYIRKAMNRQKNERCA